MLDQKDWLQTELDELTSSLEGGLASQSVSLGDEQAAKMSDGSGPSYSELSLKHDRRGACLRMYLALELSVLTGCSLTWREQATPLGRWWWVLSMPEPRIDGSGFGWLPTPSATTYGRNKGGQNPDGPERPSLETMARGGMLPTPTARDWKSTQASEATHNRNSRPLSEVVGRLLPTPSAVDANGRGYQYSQGDKSKPVLSLPGAVGAAKIPEWLKPMLPTPRASEAMHWPLRRPENIKDGSRLEDAIAFQQDLSNGTGTGRLSPCFVEWLQGYPEGYTEVD